MRTLSLTKEFDFSGDWFLPGRPEVRIPGVLRYSGTRSTLELHDTFGQFEGPIRLSSSPPTYSTVHGVTTLGTEVTMLHAARAGQSLNIGPAGARQPERIQSSWVISGAHVQPDTDYAEFSVRVPGLQVWLSKVLVHFAIETESDESAQAQTYRLYPHKAERISIPKIESELLIGIRYASEHDPWSSIAMTASAWLTIRPSIPKDIDWYLLQSRKIIALLTLMAGESMSADCIEATVGPTDQKVSVLVALNNQKICSFKNLHDFFLPRSQMQCDLAETINRWFDVYDAVESPCLLFISVLASEKLWLHVQFLSLMQALEGFHRALFGGDYMGEGEYEIVKKALGDAIPEGLGNDHKAALRSRIKYGYQYSLAKRLKALADSLAEPVRRLVFGPVADLPRSWIDTRNYYTHWDEALRPSLLGGEAMYEANVRMRNFLRALYLALMNVPEAAIVAALEGRSEIAQELMQLNSRERQRLKTGRNP